MCKCFVRNCSCKAFEEEIIQKEKRCPYCQHKHKKTSHRCITAVRNLAGYELLMNKRGYWSRIWEEMKTAEDK